MIAPSAGRPRVLLQTTIPYTEDDWHVGRFALLRDELTQYADVVARNRENGPDGNDPVLARLDESDFDQLWLFAVDTGDGITKAGLSVRELKADRSVEKEMVSANCR